MAAIERQAFSDPWPERAFRETLEEGDQVFLVAAGGSSEVAGYVLARRVGEEAEILNLGVIPAERRRGVGRGLVNAALAELEAAGAREVFLEVRESNVAALRLYQASGFRVVGRRPGYYRRPVEEALILRTAITARPS
ncbi:MAG: ribosomal protein S18-alanine N-acetyltransferase [Gemmatimonadales bacterium]